MLAAVARTGARPRETSTEVKEMADAADRIEELLARLEPDEKISLLAGRDMWHTVPVERLGIPALKVTDGPNGARGSEQNHGPSSASFPVGVAIASTWDTGLAARIGEALAEEVRSKGASVLLGPTVNIQRYPRAGRNFECFSEDPYLASRMAVAYIDGMQSQGIGACIKHFVCNDAEHERFSISSDVDERSLHEVYLAPFRAAVAEAKPWALMTAYNRVNGVYAAEHALVVELLKGEWGFDGLVMSDWWGTYGEATPVGGLDLEMPGPARWMSSENVKAALDNGSLSQDRLDDKVRRLLRLMDRAGVLDVEVSPLERADDRPEHRVLARLVAAESIVLLENRNGILPLDRAHAGEIAVIGEFAAATPIGGGGSSSVRPHYAVSVMEGISGAVGAGTPIHYSRGCVVHPDPLAIDPSIAATVDGSPGLRIEYFHNGELTGDPAYVFVVKQSLFHWPMTGDEHLLHGDSSVRLSGTLTTAQGGAHMFTLHCLGGHGRMILDGEVLLAVEPESSGEMATGEMELTAAEPHHLVVEYFAIAGSRWRELRLGCCPAPSPNIVEDAVAVAESADAAVVVVGVGPSFESEGFDRADLRLPGSQDELVAAVAAANPNTIVLVAAGSPVEMPWADDVAAIAQVWYGGQEVGNAAADVLFGLRDPGGRLPMTLPARLEDAPVPQVGVAQPGHISYHEGVFVGYRSYERSGVEPRYHFGHGLSYAEFEYRDLAIGREGDVLVVTAMVKNVGERPGSDVAQLYVAPLSRRGDHPEQELKGFSKVRLDPGEAVQIQFRLDREALSWYDPERGGWVCDPGEIEVRVGRSSHDVRLSGGAEIPPAEV
jgi:beta-glucosidase